MKILQGCTSCNSIELCTCNNTLKNNYKHSSTPEDLISNLERYELTSNSGGQDMEKSLNGEYVLFTDVIKLISELKNKL